MSATTIVTKHLVQVSGGALRVEKTGAVYPIGAETFTVGRDKGSSLYLDDKKVSLCHAELVATPYGVRLRDLDSRNGTLVEENLCGEATLRRETAIQFGETRCRFLPGQVIHKEVDTAEGFGGLVGGSNPMRALFGTLAKVAASDVTTLVTGETGTGQELVARAIHAASARRNGPYVVIDCASIPPNLVESRLFGHERGAFSGATSRFVSPFRVADGGTVFLDEIGELPTDLQMKLLRVLQEKTVQPIGSHETFPVNVRVIAATNRELAREVNKSGFRSDLYYRLNQLSVRVPPLRERTGDIPLLVAHFVRKLGFEHTLPRISATSYERLARHEWTGNVRELMNVLTQGLALSDVHGPIELYPSPGDGSEKGGDNAPIPHSPSHHEAHLTALADFELRYWRSLWLSCGGNVAEMVRVSGRSRPTVQKYLDQFQLGAPG